MLLSNLPSQDYNIGTTKHDPAGRLHRNSKVLWISPLLLQMLNFVDTAMQELAYSGVFESLCAQAICAHEHAKSQPNVRYMYSCTLDEKIQDTSNRVTSFPVGLPWVYASKRMRSGSTMTHERGLARACLHWQVFIWRIQGYRRIVL
jgi:hypothetical protein